MNHHLAPNWSNGVSETYEFKTTVFTTESGKEQRSAERLVPRRTVSFSGVAFGDYMRSLQGLMHDRGASEIVIPDPARYGAVLTRDAPAGTTSLPLDHRPVWWENGMAGAISSTWESEFVTLNGFEAAGAFDASYSDAFDRRVRGRATLAAPLTRSWPAGSVLRPAVGGRLAQQFSVSYLTNSVMRYSVELSLTPPSPTPRLTGLPALPQLGGYPVLTVEPNWAAAPAVQFHTPFDAVDYGRGVTRHFLPIDFFTRISQFNYSGRSRADVARVVRLFDRVRGRQGEFYCPTWTDDIKPISGITNGSPTMVVDIDAQRYRTSTVNRAVMIRLHDGSTFFRRVTAMQAVAGEGQGPYGPAYGPAYSTSQQGPFSEVTFDSPLPVSAGRDDIALVCWLNRSRFATDALTVEWLTDDVAQMVAQIMTLEDID